MNGFKRYLYLCAFAVFLAACTQQPAPVDDRSAKFYGHGNITQSYPNHENYNSQDAYVEPPSEPAHYTDPAKVSTVGVSDLPPPTPNHAWSNTPQPASLANTSPAYMAPPSSTAPHGTPQASAGNNPKFIWPVAGGKVISHFGPKSGGKSNDGINIAVSEGEPIWAAADGTVVYAGNQLASYGNMVIIRHEGGWMTAYAHTRSLSVKKNDSVKQGEIIGYVGMTGSVKSPQLHFAVRDGKVPMDPERYLPGT